MRNCLNLQRHRLKAFNCTLTTLETALEDKIKFIQEYDDVFRFNKMIVRRSLKRYRRWLRAVQHLKDLEQNKL